MLIGGGATIDGAPRKNLTCLLFDGQPRRAETIEVSAKTICQIRFRHSGRSAQLTFKTDTTWKLLGSEDSNPGIVVLIDCLVLEMFVGVARLESIDWIVGLGGVNDYSPVWQSHYHAPSGDARGYGLNIC